MGAENSKVTLTDEEKAALTKYSAGDIAAHNTASDLWLIIHGKREKDTEKKIDTVVVVSFLLLECFRHF